MWGNQAICMGDVGSLPPPPKKRNSEINTLFERPNFRIEVYKSAWRIKSLWSEWNCAVERMEWNVRRYDSHATKKYPFGSKNQNKTAGFLAHIRIT